MYEMIRLLQEKKYNMVLYKKYDFIFSKNNDFETLEVFLSKTKLCLFDIEYL